MRYSMKILICLLLCAGAFPTSSYADNGALSDLRIASNLSLIADWMQTREIAKTPEYSETNPILGSHPTIGSVNRYFLGVLIVHNVMGALLPPRYADLYDKGVLFVEITAVQHNAAIGVGMRF